MKKVAMLQPNYIPWKGNFDLIHKVDVYVFYDDVQYTVKDWRNRNKIKTPNGELWLTVPVIHKGKREQLICEAEIDNTNDWRKAHFKSIRNSYLKAKYFKEYEYIIEEIYLKRKWDKISELDIFATKTIAESLGIKVDWVKSSDMNITGNKDGDRVIKICKALGCDYFINGPASREYMNEELFRQAGITLEYMEYNYKEYEQLYPPFNHYVSVLDVLFNCGPEAKKFILT